MGILGLELIDHLVSPAVAIAAAAVALLLLSGIAAEALLYVEDLGHRWEARTLARRSNEPRYREHVACELGGVL